MKKPILSDYVSQEEQNLITEFGVIESKASNLSCLLIFFTGIVLYVLPVVFSSILSSESAFVNFLFVVVFLILVFAIVGGFRFSFVKNLIFPKRKILAQEVERIQLNKNKYQDDLRHYVNTKLKELIDQTLPVLDEIKKNHLYRKPIKASNQVNWEQYVNILDNYSQQLSELKKDGSVYAIGDGYWIKAEEIDAHNEYRKSRKNSQTSERMSLQSTAPKLILPDPTTSEANNQITLTEQDAIAPRLPSKLDKIKASIDELIEKIKKSTYRQYLTLDLREIGLKGEQFILEIERKKLEELGLYSPDFLIHVSQSSGDQYGFDILSLDESQEKMLIEVKTTKGSLTTPFFLTQNEFRILNTYKDCYVIARVFNFDVENMTGEFIYLSADEVLSKYSLEPEIYRLKPR